MIFHINNDDNDTQNDLTSRLLEIYLTLIHLFNDVLMPKEHTLSKIDIYCKFLNIFLIIFFMYVTYNFIIILSLFTYH